MTKLKAKYKLKVKIFIDDQEISRSFDTDLEHIASDVTVRMVDHFKESGRQKKSGAVIDTAIFTGFSVPTVWRKLRRYFLDRQRQ